MPYIVQKALEYRGRWLKPGQPLGDDHPKRSLVQTRKIKWVPEENESQIEPIARTGDRSIPDVIPVPREPKPAAPVNTEKPEPFRVEVPELMDVIAAGYPPHVAGLIVARQRAIKQLVADGAASVEEAQTLVEAMPPEEVWEMVGEKPPVLPKPEPVDLQPPFDVEKPVSKPTSTVEPAVAATSEEPATEVAQDSPAPQEPEPLPEKSAPSPRRRKTRRSGGRRKG